jgi:hypothetical protein
MITVFRIAVGSPITVVAVLSLCVMLIKVFEEAPRVFTSATLS